MIRTAEDPTFEPDPRPSDAHPVEPVDTETTTGLGRFERERDEATVRSRARTRSRIAIDVSRDSVDPYPAGFDPERARAVWQNIGRLRGTPVRRRSLAERRPGEPLPAWLGIAGLGTLAVGAVAAIWMATASSRQDEVAQRQHAQLVAAQEREQARVKLAALATAPTDDASPWRPSPLGSEPPTPARDAASPTVATAPLDTRTSGPTSTLVAAQPSRPSAPTPNTAWTDLGSARTVAVHASTSTVASTTTRPSNVITTVAPDSRLAVASSVPPRSPSIDHTPTPQVAPLQSAPLATIAPPSPATDDAVPAPTRPDRAREATEMPAIASLPVSPRDRAPIGPIGSSGIHLDRLTLATQDASGACALTTSEFVAGRDDWATICFRIVHPREKERVTVLWEHKGQVQRRARINVPATHAYNTRARLRLYSNAELGEWTVRIVSDDNVELAMRTFEITTASARGK